MLFQPLDEKTVLRRGKYIFGSLGIVLAVLWVLSIVFDWFPPSSFVLEYRSDYGEHKQLWWVWGRFDPPDTLPKQDVFLTLQPAAWQKLGYSVNGWEILGQPRLALKITGPVTIRVTLTTQRKTCATQKFDVPANVTRDIYVYCPPRPGAIR